MYPRNAQDKSDLIDGSIGENSQFHATYGYYAQGVAYNAAVLPSDLENRIVAIRVSDAVGYCLDIHDLVVSKLVANREKDLEFVADVIANKLINLDMVLVLCDRLASSETDPNRIQRVKYTFSRLTKDRQPSVENLTKKRPSL